MKISVKTFEFRVFPMETRFPFQYGIAKHDRVAAFVCARRS